MAVFSSHPHIKILALYYETATNTAGCLMGITSIISLSFLILLIYRAFFHPLAGIPGPCVARVCGYYRLYHYLRGTWHDDVVSLHKRYGRVVRIGPNEVSIVDPVGIKKVFGHGKDNATKADWYKGFHFGLPDPFNVCDKQMHGLLRRQVSAAYSMSAVLRYEPYLHSCYDLLLSKWRRLARDGKPVDVAEWTHALAFDIISEIVCGEQMGHLAEESDVLGVRKAVQDLTKAACYLGDIPTQTSIITSPITAFIQTRILGLKNPALDFLNFVAERIYDRKTGKNDADRKDMLTHFIAAYPPEQQRSLTYDPQMVRDVQTAFGAGSDTTSIAMRSIIYHVGTHPEVYARLQKEIDEFYTNNELTTPIMYNQTQQIPYLRAVVAEAVRLLPSIPGQLLRVSPGLTIDKYWIPASAMIGLSAISVNKSPEIFGPDAEDFRPERWLESENSYAKLDAKSMTFGSGARACIGKNIAMVELQKFVAQVYREFDVEIINKERPWKLDFFFIVNPTELNVRLKSRFDL